MAKKIMSSSQHEMVHEQRRPVMSANLLSAAIKGNKDVLLQCLGLSKEQKEVKVTIEASHSAPEHQAAQSELQSANRFGDTVLHLLLTRRHNELAVKVFQRDMSLLKARNKMSETPLHCAAKVGNKEAIRKLIKIDHAVVKDALEEINEYGDTALHIAAKHGHKNVGRVLMNLDAEVAYKVNSEMSSPLYIAIVNGHTEMAQTMLEVDPNMARTQFLDGMFPAHVAARMGNFELVMHFMEDYPDDAELLDPRGRNLLHTAVEENQLQLVWVIFEDTSVGEMVARMSNAKDYDGNTPFHVAAMMKHRQIMRTFFENNTHHDAETIENNDGFTPFELCLRRVLGDAITEENTIAAGRITGYGRWGNHKFTRKWFEDIMEPSLPNGWERIQVIGLGSVLITTVTFAAAFTIPGGYDQDHGTPVLGRRYMLRAFIIANALAFIGGFLSLFTILQTVGRGTGITIIESAVRLFEYSADCMIVAFGLGMYVTLAPVCLPIAILLLVITLLIGCSLTRGVFILIGINYVRKAVYGDIRSLSRCMIAVSFVVLEAVSFLLIFGLAFM